MALKAVLAGCLIGAGVSLFPLPGFAESGAEQILTQGKFFGELRYRHEFVDQEGPAPVKDEARANTLRANVGFETGKYENFQALVEAQFVQSIGARDFNDTVNGKGNFPVVADPDNQELNQAWLSWSGIRGGEFKLGRQGINLDNERFIGTVNWRQNDQTFDSILFNYTGLEKAALSYGYILNVNRVFGDDHPAGDLDTNSHFVNASYRVADWLKLSGYGYWFDFEELPARSSKTMGLRATGQAPLTKEWIVSYEAEAAHQSDFADNPVSYDEQYYHVSPSVSGYGWTFGAGYEVLGGNGTAAFQTPLATLHKFNGWADKFLDTPAAGLEDSYASVSYKLSGIHEAVDGTTVTAVYHDFSGDKKGDFGSEIDLSVGKSFALPEGIPLDKLNVLAKYADYQAQDAPYTDTQKVWLQIGINF